LGLGRGKIPTFWIEAWVLHKYFSAISAKIILEADRNYAQLITGDSKIKAMLQNEEAVM